MDQRLELHVMEIDSMFNKHLILWSLATIRNMYINVYAAISHLRDYMNIEI